MRAEEIDHGAVRLRLADGGAQAVGGKAGQVKEALRPPLVRQDKGQRAQSQRGAIFGGCRGVVTNCQHSHGQVWQ